MKTKSDYPFDFSLFINEHVICQRFFDEYNFKNDSVSFNQAIEIISRVTQLIDDFLKSKSIDLLWTKNKINNKVLVPHEVKKDLLSVTITFKSKPVVSSIINIDRYQPKVKYNIDIRPILPLIINDIRQCLMSAELQSVNDIH